MPCFIGGVLWGSRWLVDLDLPCRELEAAQVKEMELSGALLTSRELMMRLMCAQSNSSFRNDGSNQRTTIAASKRHRSSSQGTVTKEDNRNEECRVVAVCQYDSRPSSSCSDMCIEQTPSVKRVLKLEPHHSECVQQSWYVCRTLNGADVESFSAGKTVLEEKLAEVQQAIRDCQEEVNQKEKQRNAAWEQWRAAHEESSSSRLLLQHIRAEQQLKQAVDSAMGQLKVPMIHTHSVAARGHGHDLSLCLVVNVTPGKCTGSASLTHLAHLKRLVDY